MLAPNNIPSLDSGRCEEKQPTLFDNLMTMDELMAMLKHQYCRRTIYRWIGQGMPYKRIRNRFWFPRSQRLCDMLTYRAKSNVSLRLIL